MEDLTVKAKQLIAENASAGNDLASFQKSNASVRSQLEAALRTIVETGTKLDIALKSNAETKSKLEAMLVLSKNTSFSEMTDDVVEENLTVPQMNPIAHTADYYLSVARKKPSLAILEAPIQNPRISKATPPPTKYSESKSDNLFSTLDDIISGTSTTVATRKIRVMLMCNWTDSRSLCELWNKQSEDGNGNWKNLEIAATDVNIDYYVVINAPPTGYKIPDMKKVIIFHMEPHIPKRQTLWKEWSRPDPSKVYKIFPHVRDLNNLEWHLSWTYQKFMKCEIAGKDRGISVILSDKMEEPGQQLRHKFTEQMLMSGIPVDIYGSTTKYSSSKGRLPYHAKDAGIFPYKYHYAAENNAIENYVTEKLIDGILGECLVFYYGCPNVSKHINSKAYIQLSHANLSEDMNIVRAAMLNNEWEKRIDVIRAEKQRILNELQFFPRLQKFLSSSS